MHKIITTGRLIAKILMLGTLWISCAQAAGVNPAGIIPLDGRDAPTLVLNNIDGQVYDIRHSRGKWVFVHFWASWCSPCRKEMKTIAQVAPQFNNSRLDIVLINTAEDEDTVFSFLGNVAPDLTTLMDTDGLATEKWRPRGLPSTYLVNPDGKLEYIVLGGRPWNTPVYLDFLKKLITK